MTFDQPLAAQRRDDPIARELRRQLRAGVRQMRGARPGEGARAVGSALAFGAAYGRAIDLDSQFKTFLRRAGRTRLTEPEIHPAQIIAMLRDHGQTDTRLPPLADLTTRRRVYDGLLAAGLTALMEKEAQSFAAASADFDKFNGVFRPVVNNNCQPIMDNISVWSGVATIACSPPSLGTGVGQAACAVASGVLAGLIIRYWTYC